MARLMLSAGIFSAFAAVIAVRRRGLVSGSPPFLAAMLISLIRRVKILPRLASSAPFLCLIVAHLEWPDMVRPRIYKSIFKDPWMALDSPSEEITGCLVTDNRRTQIIAWTPRAQPSTRIGRGCRAAVHA